MGRKDGGASSLTGDMAGATDTEGLMIPAVGGLTDGVVTSVLISAELVVSTRRGSPIEYTLAIFSVENLSETGYGLEMGLGSETSGRKSPSVLVLIPSQLMDGPTFLVVT